MNYRRKFRRGAPRTCGDTFCVGVLSVLGLMVRPPGCNRLHPKLQPHVSRLQPHVSRLQPHAPCLHQVVLLGPLLLFSSASPLAGDNSLTGAEAHLLPLKLLSRSLLHLLLHLSYNYHYTPLHLPLGAPAARNGNARDRRRAGGRTLTITLTKQLLTVEP